MTPEQKSQRFWSLVLYVGIAVALIWVLAGVFSAFLGWGSAWGFTSLWEDDFETYNLGDLTEQGNWSGSTTFDVVDDIIYSGTKGGKETGSSGQTTINFTPNDDVSSGVKKYQFAVRPNNWSSFYTGSNFEFNFRNTEAEFLFGLRVFRTATTDKFCITQFNQGDCVWDTEFLISKGNWVLITITADFNNLKFSVEATGADGTMTPQENMNFNLSSTPYILHDLRLHGGYQMFANFDYFNIPVAEASVWGISPASGTEITNLDTILTIGYEGLEDYDSLYITFRHPPTGLFTEAKIYDIDEIGSSGELEINLQSFNFEKNANWYLHAVAVYEGYQYQGEYFLSGYGWVWTNDLTAGTYYLVINIEGFDPIFSMSNFEAWYTENSKFDEPTIMFQAIAGFFSPIFSVVGEFGNRIKNYFDVAGAYSKGYDIGKTIPVFTYYVGQITHFLGGFPIMVWTLIIILILIGIFILRLIMKFIPFLGGS